MYTSQSGAKYRKARESRSRSYPDMDALAESARKAIKTSAKSKALKGK